MATLTVYFGKTGTAIKGHLAKVELFGYVVAIYFTKAKTLVQCNEAMCECKSA
jgi:hypothetical protein